MDWSTIESALAKSLELVSELAPAAAAGGPVAGEIGAVIGKVAAFASTAAQDAANTAEVISDTDLASIQASATQIQALNDKLAATIAAS